MGRRVLVVDDIESNRKLLEIFFSELNYLTDIAEDGEKAITLLDKGKYDFIVMDLNMPKKNGMATIKEIREKEWKNKNIPIIVLSAFTNNKIKQECFFHGVNEILVKPIDLVQLENSVKRLNFLS